MLATGGPSCASAAATTEIARRGRGMAACRLDSADIDRVDVLIWNGSSSGGSYGKRMLSARRWMNIENNYPHRTRTLARFIDAASDVGIRGRWPHSLPRRTRDGQNKRNPCSHDGMGSVV